MATRIQTAEKEQLSVVAVNAAGGLISGLAIGVTILKQDGTWFKGSDRTWTASLFSNPMPENAVRPGQYEFLFWPKDGDYQCTFLATVNGGVNAASVVNSPWAGDMIVGLWVDNIDSPISESGETSEEVLKRIGGGGTVLSDELRRQRGILDEILRSK